MNATTRRRVVGALWAAWTVLVSVSATSAADNGWTVAGYLVGGVLSFACAVAYLVGRAEGWERSTALRWLVVASFAVSVTLLIIGWTA